MQFACFSIYKYLHNECLSLPGLFTASAQVFSVNAFRWYFREKLTQITLPEIHKQLGVV